MHQVIECENLGKQFGDTLALQDLSLQVQAGEVFGFLGPNGAGKTTTIRMLLGLLRSTKGRCRVMGLDVAAHGAEVRGQCGAMLEAPGHYENLSVLDNLKFFGRLQSVPRSELAGRIDAQLECFGLSHKRDELAGALSSGMKQKLGIARAVLHQPALLILDEPTRGLDPSAIHELRGLLRNMADQQGTAIFITSHNLGEMEKICDRVGLLKQGQLLRVAQVADFINVSQCERIVLSADHIEPSLSADLQDAELIQHEGQNDQLSFSVPHGESLADWVAGLVGQGLAIQEIRRESISLEQAYLRLMEQHDVSD